MVNRISHLKSSFRFKLMRKKKKKSLFVFLLSNRMNNREHCKHSNKTTPKNEKKRRTTTPINFQTIKSRAFNQFCDKSFFFFHYFHKSFTLHYNFLGEIYSNMQTRELNLTSKSVYNFSSIELALKMQCV